MTNIDFANGMLRLKSGIGKELSTDSLMVYWDLLQDLPASSFLLGIDRVILEHKYATFPTIAELRKSAVESKHGEVNSMSSAEAWQLAWKAVCAIDLDVEGSLEKSLNTLPPLVADCMRKFGVVSLVTGTEPLTVVRAQFTKFFTETQQREERKQLYPTSILNELKAIRDTQSTAALVDQLQNFGRITE